VSKHACKHEVHLLWVEKEFYSNDFVLFALAQAAWVVTKEMPDLL